MKFKVLRHDITEKSFVTAVIVVVFGVAQLLYVGFMRGTTGNGEKPERYIDQSLVCPYYVVLGFSPTSWLNELMSVLVAVLGVVVVGAVILASI